MLRGHWLPVLAVVGLVLASQGHASPAQNAHRADTNNAQSQAQPIQATPPSALAAIQSDAERIAKALETENAREGSAKEQQEAENNFKAQRDMATAARRTVLIAASEAFITFVGVLLVGWTLYHTKRAADAAQDVLIKLERPHLFIENVKFSPAGAAPLSKHWFEVPKDELAKAIWEVQYDIVNYGRSPAIIKERAAGIYIGTDFPQIPSPNQNDIWKNEFAIGAGAKRGPFRIFWRGKMTQELLHSFTTHMIHMEGVVRPDMMFFVGIKYESVQGLKDEIGVLWEYAFGAEQWIQETWTQEKYPNYTYRRLGKKPVD